MGDLSKLATSQHSAIFRTIADTLKADPILSDVVDSWITWEGGVSDAADPPADKVTVKLMPGGTPQNWISSNETQANVQVWVEVTVPGATPVENLLNLWAALAGGARDTNGQAIPSALFPGDKSLYRALTNLGADVYRVSEPAYDAFRNADGVRLLATGLIEVDLKIRTRV